MAAQNEPNFALFTSWNGGIINPLSGLQITAGQRTMSGQNWVLTGQILGLPDMLSGHLPTRSDKF